jgi:2-phosphosulfolactate phosphatase
MSQQLNVYELPTSVAPEELAGTTAVVIDVLRATTTILYALQAGASEVIPCLEIGDALKIAASLPRSQVVLGGERGGLPIDGFDLGNSPREYDPPAVAGKTVVMTTTNGTRAMDQCRIAESVLIGGFVNAAALADRLAARERIALVCAGSDGDVTRDDVLFAGLMVDRL